MATPVEFADVVPVSPLNVSGCPFGEITPSKSLDVIPDPEITKLKEVPLGTLVVTIFMSIDPYSGTVSLELIE